MYVLLPGHEPGYDEAEPPGAGPQWRVGSERDRLAGLESVEVSVYGEETTTKDVPDGRSDHEEGLQGMRDALSKEPPMRK